MPDLSPRTNASLTAGHAALFQHILRGCPACNIMCMTSAGTGHIRYQHIHRVSPVLRLCITRRRSLTHYYVYVSEAYRFTTIIFMLEVGVWPMPSGLSNTPPLAPAM
ncbi:hypothetical protein VTO73DRAFT_11654 [Trametes versicolor]